MKKLFVIVLLTAFVMGCTAEIGSEQWCADLKDKPKGDWTATEAKDFTQHCVF